MPILPPPCTCWFCQRGERHTTDPMHNQWEPVTDAHHTNVCACGHTEGDHRELLGIPGFVVCDGPGRPGDDGREGCPCGDFILAPGSRVCRICGHHEWAPTSLGGVRD